MPDPVFQQALTLLSGSKYAELSDLTLWVHEQKGQQRNGIGRSSLCLALVKQRVPRVGALSPNTSNTSPNT